MLDDLVWNARAIFFENYIKAEVLPFLMLSTTYNVKIFMDASFFPAATQMAIDIKDESKMFYRVWKISVSWIYKTRLEKLMIER